MHRPIITILAFFLALAAPPALAGDVEVVPGVTFSYGDPAGLCRLDPERGELEAALYESLEQPHLATLAIFFDCAFVEALRAGRAVEPSEWALLSATKREGTLQAYPTSRRDFVRDVTPVLEEQMGGYAEGDFDEILSEANGRIDEELAKQPPGAGTRPPRIVQPLGLLDADADAIYYALLSLPNREDGAGTETRDRELTIGAITMIRGYIVNVYVSHPFDAGGGGGGDSPDPLLDRARAFVDDLIARNDPDGLSVPPAPEVLPTQSSSDDIYIQAAMIGIFILVVGLVWVNFYSKRKR